MPLPGLEDAHREAEPAQPVQHEEAGEAGADDDRVEIGLHPHLTLLAGLTQLVLATALGEARVAAP